MLNELGSSRLPLWLNPLLCAALLLAVMVRLRLPLRYGLPLVVISAIIPGMGLAPWCWCSASTPAAWP